MKYEVKKGENLLAIAKRYSSSLSEIMKLNSITNPNLIKVGQILTIPDEDMSLSPITNDLTPENLKQKYDIFINFLEGKKLKKQLDSSAKANILELFHAFLDFQTKDLKEVSYILATIHWETNRTYKPLEEYGKGRGKEYGFPYKGTGKTYYGRGYVQLTWYDNYARFTKILSRLGYDVDLINHPEQACIPELAAKIAVSGMRDGKFTGHDLDDYFTPLKADWFNARKIINGKDMAVVIADIAKEIYYIIK